LAERVDIRPSLDWRPNRSGYCIWYKRLEEGIFKFPAGDGASVEVESAELALLLEGIELADAKRRRRFVPRPAPV